MQIFDYTDEYLSIPIKVTLVIDSVIEGTYQLLTTENDLDLNCDDNILVRIVIVSKDREPAFDILKQLTEYAMHNAQVLDWQKQPLYKWAKRKTQNA